ncbi:hypothetical protein ES703_71859 [subsurface metagenome]
MGFLDENRLKMGGSMDPIIPIANSFSSSISLIHRDNFQFLSIHRYPHFDIHTHIDTRDSENSLIPYQILSSRY